MFCRTRRAKVVGEILAIDADLQDGELIAAETADHVTGTQAALQAGCDALQTARRRRDVRGGR